MVARAEALARMPESLDAAEAAPLMCAGLTTFNALRHSGALMIIGVSPDPIEVAPMQLIMGRKRIQGWASGTAADGEETLRFAELTGVRPMIERYPLAKAAEAYARMLGGKAEFRAVLTM